MAIHYQSRDAKLLAAPGPDVWVISIHGTGHMSYSDAPFTMPGTISKFGGTFLDPGKVLSLTTKLVEGYFLHGFDPKNDFSIRQFPDARMQVSN